MKALVEDALGLTAVVWLIEDDGSEPADVFVGSKLELGIVNSTGERCYIFADIDTTTTVEVVEIK